MTRNRYIGRTIRQRVAANRALNPVDADEIEAARIRRLNNTPSDRVSLVMNRWLTTVHPVAPEKTIFVQWVERYEPDVIEFAFQRTIQKASGQRRLGTPMSLDYKVRYAWAVMKSRAAETTQQVEEPLTI